MSYSYKQKDIKLLWYRAGGRCSFPGCNEELSLPDTDSILGEMAHIVAKSADGLRGQTDFPEDRLNEYDNLILLCPTHHTIVDSPKSQLGSDQLRKMKRQHEAWVRERLSKGCPWKVELSQLYYLNVPRFSILAGLAGEPSDVLSYSHIDNLHSLGPELASLMARFSNMVNRIHPKSIPMAETRSIGPELIGTVCSFDESFRTKNIPYLDEYLQNGAHITGDIERDPHIYKKFSNFKLILSIDPRWITTATSFAQFKPPGGIGRFAGLCLVKDLDPQRAQVYATPLIIGIPVSDLERMLFGA